MEISDDIPGERLTLRTKVIEPDSEASWLATIISSDAIQRILSHLQLPTSLPVLAPARAPPSDVG